VSKPEVRAYVIRWLISKGIEHRPWKGLDPRRAHFACGCSIIWPSGRAWLRAKTYNPGFRSRVCADHQRALGDGTAL
jgi:hypothetical protein